MEDRRGAYLSLGQSGRLNGSQKVVVKNDDGSQTFTAKDIIVASGSVPFVPPEIELDGKTVFTSNEAIKLDWLPDSIAIIGSGYIGLEFSDVYTALGSKVTLISATGKMMLAHAASAQGIVAVENMCGRSKSVNYNSIPAAVFTHPEISFVGMTEPQAKELAKEKGFNFNSAKAVLVL